MSIQFEFPAMRAAALIIIWALMSTAAAAQGNPNSPRERTLVQPPAQPQGPKWFEVVEPERWPTLNKPINEPPWGHVGKCGWTGVAGKKPPGC